MSRSAPCTRSILCIAIVLAGSACKKEAARATSDAPGIADDIALIEAELEQNADDLEAEGIYVARASRDAAPTRVQQQPPAEAEAEEPAEVDEEDAPDLGGSEQPVDAESPASNVENRESQKSKRDGYWSRWLDKRGRKKNEAERCQRICDLAEATCDLADKICELAQSHPDEVRYDEACSRAEHQCRVAAEACTACAD
jgi:hypothetical protein